jgi:hypothetical protein
MTGARGIGAVYARNPPGGFRMSRKTLAAVVLTNGAATAVAVGAATHGWPVALAAGAFSAILARVALAVSLAPAATPGRRNDRPRGRFGRRGAGRPF